MRIEIVPEPSPAERRAILAALESAPRSPVGPESRWWESALADLRYGASAQERGSDSRVVEP
jgi:hypothetical protein